MKIKKLIKTAALTVAALTMITSFSPATNSNPVASSFSPVISAQAKTAPHLNYTKLFLQCGQKKRLKVKGYRGKSDLAQVVSLYKLIPQQDLSLLHLLEKL